MFFVLSRAWDKEKILSPQEKSKPQTFGFRVSIFYHWATETLWWARPNRIFLILFTKHDAIDIADPCCMQDACHIWTSYRALLTLESLWLSCWEFRSVDSEVLRFDSSWGLWIFSLYHARNKTKNIPLVFFTELKTYHLPYSTHKSCLITVMTLSGLWFRWSRRFDL